MLAPTFLCIGAQKCGTTWLAHAVQPKARGWPRWTIKVSDPERQLLAAEYKTEVARLEQLLGRSLPGSMG